jgi:hypothetical protein
VKIELEIKKSHLIYLSLLLIIFIGILVIAAPPNGHDVDDIDFSEGVPKLRLADTGGNGVFWDIQEVAPSNDLTFKYMDEKVRITAMGNVGIGTDSPTQKLDVRGGLVLDTGSNANIYTGTAPKDVDQKRYLQILNSPFHASASGIKVGGLLVADSFSHANPGKNDAVIKGNLRVDGTVSGASIVCQPFSGTRTASCPAGFTMVSCHAVTVPSGDITCLVSPVNNRCTSGCNGKFQVYGNCCKIT